MDNSVLRFALGFYNNTQKISFTDLLGSPAGATYDTLLSTAPNSESHLDIVGIARMTSPSGVFYGGTAYNANDFSSPDITGSVWTKGSISLPLSGSSVMCGNYLFDYKIGLNLLGTFSGYNSGNYFAMTGNYVPLLGATPTGLKLQVYSASTPTGHEGTYDIVGVQTLAGDTQFIVSGAPSPYSADPNDRVRIIFTSAGKTYNYCYTQPSPSINISSSCVFSQLTVEDVETYVTKFGSVSVTPTVTRAWSITAPSTYSASPVTGTTNPFTIGYGTSVLGGKNLWSGVYDAQLTTGLSFNVEQWDAYWWIVVYDSIVSTAAETVTCDTCYCNLRACYENMLNKWKGYMGLTGNSPNFAKADDLGTQVLLVNALWMDFELAERCGADIRAICAEIKAIIVANDCQCQDPSTVVSQEIVPIALQTISGSGCCKVTFGSGGSGLPSSPILGDVHYFNATGGAYTEGDIYWYNGSAWVFQYNNIGATGATGATGASGSNGSDGVAVVFDNTLETPVQRTNNTFGQFTGMTSGALTNLSTVGSKYVVDAVFTTENPVYGGQVKINIDGIDIPITVYGTTTNELTFSGDIYWFFVTLEFTLIDLATNKFSIKWKVNSCPANLFVIGSLEAITTQTVTNYASVTFSALGKSDGTHYVSCQQLSVKYYNK